jgi:hypothetical protein
MTGTHQQQLLRVNRGEKNKMTGTNQQQLLRAHRGENNSNYCVPTEEKKNKMTGTNQQQLLRAYIHLKKSILKNKTKNKAIFM